MTSQWPAGASGESTSAAPATKICDHRIDRQAAASDHDAGLAGGAEVRRNAAGGEGPGDGQGGVFFAKRAIGADGEQPLAGPLYPGGDGQALGRAADVDQAPAASLGDDAQGPGVDQAGVQAADDVETGSRASTRDGIHASAI